MSCVRTSTLLAGHGWAAGSIIGAIGGGAGGGGDAGGVSSKRPTAAAVVPVAVDPAVSRVAGCGAT